MKRDQRHDDGAVEIRVKGRNLTVTPALHDQVVRKLQRLEKYHDRLRLIDVELWRESVRESDQRFHVDASTQVLGKPIRVCTDGTEMHAAIDEAADRLYRQLNRQKERLKDHHGSRLGELAAPELLADEDSTEAEDQAAAAGNVPPSIVTEVIDLEPLFEDEAIEEMRARGEEFFVFLNARSEKMNVLYRREDGQYGLIQPRRAQ